LSESFLHGVEVVEIDDGARSITTVTSGIIGLVGTAPKGAVNTPVLIHGNIREAVSKFGSPGYGFTIPDALDAIMDQTGAMVVVINVADATDDTLETAVTAASMTFDSTGKIQLPHVAVSSVTLTGPVTATVTFTGTTLTLPTGATLTTLKSADGVTTYQLTTDYTVANGVVTQVTAGALTSSQKVLATYTVTGIASGTDYTVDADNGAITLVAGAKIASKATLSVAYSYLDPTKVLATKVVGGVNASTSAYTGVHALVAAQSTVGVTPRILIAPGYTHQKTGTTANAVVSELLGIAAKLKAVIVADGPGTTDEAAIAYRNDWGSPRVDVVDPWVQWTNPVTGATESQPASARAAGLIALRDNEKGFWWSPSNQEINGIVGVSRPIDFQMGDTTSAANILNENEVTTIIYLDGYRLWGNRTCSSDPKWAFLSVRRTADMIEQSLLAAHLWAVDRNITKTYLADVVEGVNNYLRHLKAIGAIIDGKAWADPELNTADVLAAGRVYIDFDFCPPMPAEHITFQATLNTKYLAEVLD
jgi:phage tail sheath protein FI